MIEEWYEDRPDTKKVLRRRCAASDCDVAFDVPDYRQKYCSPACRQAEWQKERKRQLEKTRAENTDREAVNSSR